MCKRKLINIFFIVLFLIQVSACGKDQYDEIHIDEIGNYINIKEEQEKVLITSEELEVEIESELLKYSTEKIVEDRPLKKRDVATIVYSVFYEGKIYSGFKDIEEYISVGAGVFQSKVENEMIGMELNETKEIEVDYAEDDENVLFAGKTVVFKVTLKEITTYIQPELSKKFLKREYGLENKEDFYEYVKNKAINIKESCVRDDVEEKLMKKVISETEFDSKYKDLCNEKYQELMERYSKYANLYGMTLDDTLKGFQLTEELVYNNAEYYVASWEICKYLIEKENLYLSNREKNEIALSIAIESGYSNIDEYAKDNGEEALEQDVYMEVVLNFLYEHAKISEKR